MSRSLTLSAALLLLLAGVAQAQQRPDRPRVRTRETIRAQSETTVTHVRRLSMVIGADVALHGGTAVGPVEDIVINDDGCIEFVVIAYEEKFLPVPWTIVTVNFEERTIILDLDEARLAKAPMFTGDDWSVLVEADWSGRVATFFQADLRQPGRDRDRDRRDRPDRGTRPRGEDRDDGGRRGDDEGDDRGDRGDDRRDDDPRRPADDPTPGERPRDERPTEEPADEGSEQPTTPEEDPTPPDVEEGSEAPTPRGERPETPPPPRPSAGETPNDN